MGTDQKSPKAGLKVSDPKVLIPVSKFPEASYHLKAYKSKAATRDVKYEIKHELNTTGSGL